MKLVASVLVLLLLGFTSVLMWRDAAAPVPGEAGAVSTAAVTVGEPVSSGGTTPAGTGGAPGTDSGAHSALAPYAHAADRLWALAGNDVSGAREHWQAQAQPQAPASQAPAPQAPAEAGAPPARQQVERAPVTRNTPAAPKKQRVTTQPRYVDDDDWDDDDWDDDDWDDDDDRDDDDDDD